MTENTDAQRQQLIASLRKAGVFDERMLSAMSAIPRELFVPITQRDKAYADCALPIDMGQTISQPLIIARMTQALQLSGRERVLEIGTGSGYQTAILSRLAAYVYSIERHQQLAYWAASRLLQLEVRNVSLYVGDGSLGLPEEAPFDRILVTASAPELPAQLISQLVGWGILVIPVGGHEQQDLLIVQCTPHGPQQRSLGKCVFVPLIGQQGWSE